MIRSQWTRIWIGIALTSLFVIAPSAYAADDTARFYGQWQTTIPNNGQNLTLVSIHDASGFNNYVILPNGSMPVGSGAFSAVDGKWTAGAAAPNDSGTYQFTDDNTAVCTNAAGQTVTWKRDNTPLPPVINQQGPGPGPAPPGPTPQSGPVQPPKTGLATPTGNDNANPSGQSDVSAADAAGAAAYMDGLEAIKNKQWTDAIQSLSQAIATAPTAPHYCARAIAEMMSGNMGSAGNDFDQAGRLSRHDPMTRAWYTGFFYLTNHADRLYTVWGGQYDGKPPLIGPAKSSEAVPGYCMALANDKSSPSAAEVRGKLEQSAADFAESAEAAPELFDALMKRMNGEFAAGKIPETLRDLAPLRARMPLDDTLLQIQAVCLRNLGQLQVARQELTGVLTDDPTRSSAYSERAIVEARLGNLARARADMALAAKFDAAAAAKMAPLIQKEIAAWTTDPGTESPDKLYAALRRAGEAGQTVEQLLPLATELEHCMNAHRLHWDEGYQDRLRELGDPIRANPRDVAALLAFGEFLFRESDIQAEHPGPWSPLQPFRYTANDQSKREIELADQTFDAVLAIDPSNASAMSWKAAICLRRNQWDQGTVWVDKAYAIRRDLPELLELLSRILNVDANTAEADAQNLRSTKTWTDFGPLWDTVWTHEPTKEELGEAAGLEESAKQMWQGALDDLTKAAALAGDTANGHYYGGLLQYRKGNLDGAVAEFIKATLMDFSRRNSDALVDALFKDNQVDAAVTVRFKFMLTRQTTTVMLMNGAYVNIQKGAFDRGQDYVNQAMLIDPGETKIDAYAASIATATGKPQDAIHWYNIALALEEAHANSNGYSLWHADHSPDAEGLGMTLLLDLRAAARAAELGQHDQVMIYLNRNLQLEPRIAAAELKMPAYHTLLPSPKDPTIEAPKTALALFAWTHVMHAYALCAERRYDDASAECGTVWNLPRDPLLYSAQQRALALMMRWKMSKEDPDAAARQQWQADIAAERGLKMSEVERISQLEHLNNNYDLRRFATNTMFNLNAEDQSVPDDAALPNQPASFSSSTNTPVQQR